MIKNILILFFIIFFIAACSFKSYENQWQYDSSTAFNSYVQNSFKDNILLAKDDLSNSVRYAKQGANFNQLARIYLGECAINFSIGIKKDCIKYKEIEKLVSIPEIIIYNLLLEDKVKKDQIEFLPKQYKKFYEYKLEKKYDLAFNSIKEIEQISSIFIASSLIKENLNKSQIEFLIEKASYYGYKRLVLYWLNNLYKIENDEKKRNLILKKIEILLN